MPLAINQFLQERYTIQALLGEGGMGSVYRAFDQRLNKPVAIKERRPDSTSTAQSLNDMRHQFQREAQVLADLSHLNLPRVTDFFSWAGSEYIVMDFVAGESLDRVATRYPNGFVPEELALHWADEILDALDYLHSRSIIHRDIKPQNIILRPDGHPVLVDFGLVKLYDPRNPGTATMLRGMGTPQYASPEQYGRDTGHTDPRSDLYSLGASLFELLTGQPPLDLSQRTTGGGIQPPPSTINRMVSPLTDQAIVRALELAPARRFQTAREMRQALVVAAANLKTQPRRPLGPVPQPVQMPVTPPAPQPGPHTPSQPTLKQPTPPVQQLTQNVSATPPVQSGGQLVTQGVARPQTQPRSGISPVLIFALAAVGVIVVVGLVFGLFALLQQVGRAPVVTVVSSGQATATTSHPADMPTQLPTFTPIISPTPAGTPTPRTVQDNFSDPNSGWKNNPGEGYNYGNDGRYHIMLQRSANSGLFSVKGDDYTDFDMRVDAGLASNSGGYGVVFDYVDGSNFYLLMVNPQTQQWAVGRNVNGNSTYVQDWATSYAIQRGSQINQLRVLAQGSNVSFYANGTLLGTISGYPHTPGEIGLAGVATDSSAVDAAFDNFSITPK